MIYLWKKKKNRNIKWSANIFLKDITRIPLRNIKYLLTTAKK